MRPFRQPRACGHGRQLMTPREGFAVRIGVVPMLDRSWGGMYQYSVTFLHALADLGLGSELLVFVPAERAFPEDLDLSSFRIEVLPVFDRAGVFRRLTGRLLSPRQLSSLARLAHSVRTQNPRDGRPKLFFDSAKVREWFSRFELDLLLFTVDDELSFQTGIPYVVAIHDLQHCINPQWLEYVAESDWERREYRMRNAATYATAIMVDSEAGKEDVLRFYGETGVDPDSVIPLPFVPAHYLKPSPTDEERQRVRREFDLPAWYLFYPAQFWPHKNHRRIVEALGILAAQGLEPDLVLAGSKSGRLRRETFDQMMRSAENLGVSSQVHYLGYAPDEAMSALYAEAEALVIPVAGTPTSIPVVEAWQAGCPVITSDFPAIREHVGDAAVFVNHESAESIAEGISLLLGDPELRDTLVARGRARLGAYTYKDFVDRVGEIIDYATWRLSQSSR